MPKEPLSLSELLHEHDEIDSLRAENEHLKTWLADREEWLVAERAENERLEEQANRMAGTLVVSTQEIERLREELAEWQSLHAAEAELRGLVESHMDTARGQWQCVDEIQRLLVDNVELSTECDQWGEKLAEVWAEVAELRAALDHAKAS